MKNIYIILLISTGILSCRNAGIGDPSPRLADLTQKADTSEMTNNFYDNTGTYPLMARDLVVEGEISNPGRVDFSRLSKHSVIVKETIPDSSGSDRFVGAYRFDGYSLFDILNDRIPNKANGSDFKSVIDLYVEIENDRGQKVIFSWGEIYYPNNLHNIIIATAVSRIVPSRTRDLWPLPNESLVVAGNDLVTERNISSPVKITVRSYSGSFKTQRNMNPMYSAGIEIFDSSKRVDVIIGLQSSLSRVTYNTVFYGRGRGIHSTTPFSGILLKDLLNSYYPVTREKMQTGIICLCGIDGYRCVASYSEIFNRNDQQEFLLIQTKPGEDGGLFRIFAAADFFSDRAVKSVSEIHLGF